MDAIAQERDRLALEHGPWRDRILLAPGLYTSDQTGNAAKSGALLQAVADTVGDLANMTVIDLGAAEGLFTVEMAAHCKHVTAVEGRLGNVEKARFATRNLPNVQVVHRDVRDLDTARRYDIVLCLGLLYHLEGEAAVQLCHALGKITGRVAVIDTQIAHDAKRSIDVYGQTYSGRPVREFDPGASTEEQEALSRSGIGNPEAFWLTRSSLFNLLADAGFTSVMELQVPHYGTWNDRVMLICFRGRQQSLATITGSKTVRWGEGEDHGRHPNDTRWADVKRRVAPHVPQAVKQLARRRQRRKLAAFFRR